MMGARYLQVSTTVAKKADANKIATILINERLAACVQIMPVHSAYRWKGKLVNTKELLCIIKTDSGHYKKVERRLKEIHPYDLPEIVAVPYAAGSPEYLKWVSGQIRS
jgi:periplasmic divalent cation tolerance protein